MAESEQGIKGKSERELKCWPKVAIILNWSSWGDIGKNFR